MHSTAGASLPVRARAARFLRYVGSSTIAAHACFASAVALFGTPFERPAGLPLCPFRNCPAFRLFFAGEAFDSVLIVPRPSSRVADATASRGRRSGCGEAHGPTRPPERRQDRTYVSAHYRFLNRSPAVAIISRAGRASGSSSRGQKHCKTVITDPCRLVTSTELMGVEQVRVPFHDLLGQAANVSEREPADPRSP